MKNFIIISLIWGSLCMAFDKSLDSKKHDSSGAGRRTLERKARPIATHKSKKRPPSFSIKELKPISPSGASNLVEAVERTGNARWNGIRLAENGKCDEAIRNMVEAYNEYPRRFAIPYLVELLTTCGMLTQAAEVKELIEIYDTQKVTLYCKTKGFKLVTGDRKYKEYVPGIGDIEYKGRITPYIEDIKWFESNRVSFVANNSAAFKKALENARKVACESCRSEISPKDTCSNVVCYAESDVATRQVFPQDASCE